jgi:hypothetical protein
VGLCIPLSLLGKNSVKTFPRERKIVGGAVFYAVRVVSKERRRLILTRTSCLNYVTQFSVILKHEMQYNRTGKCY